MTVDPELTAHARHNQVLHRPRRRRCAPAGTGHSGARGTVDDGAPVSTQSLGRRHRMDISSLNIVKRRKKYFSFFLHEVPRSKKGPPHKSDIQNCFIQQMKSTGKHALTTDIAVQIISYTGDRRTPSVAAFAKNIVDLMHKADYLRDASDREYLPFMDDSQIKYLFVKYILADGDSTIFIKVRPFSAFVSDLHLVAEHGVEEESNYGPDTDDEDYRDLLANKEKYLSFLSEKAYDALLRMSLAKIQSGFGELISISPHFVRSAYPKRSPFGRRLREVYSDWQELLLGASIRLKLPGIPVGEHGGDSTEEQKKRYRKEIKASLERYKDKFRLINELQHPVVISVIYRPGNMYKEKDIDNIMLDYIIPISNGVLQPPASLFGLTEYTYEGELVKVPLAKEMRGTAIGYEIIQIPRQKQKGANGEVYLGFRLDDGSESLIDSTDEYVDRFLKSNRDGA